MGSGLLGLECGVLIVATWFVMKSYTWRNIALVLCRCCFGILWVYASFCCDAGGIGSVSSGMMCDTHWGGCLGARPGWNIMYPCGSTLGGSAGAAYGVVSGACTLRGGVTCGGAALVNISVNLRSADVCLSPKVVSGLLGVGLRRKWVRSAVECVAAFL